VTALVGFLLVLLFVRDPDIERTGQDAEQSSFAVFNHTDRSLLDPVFTLGLVSLLTAASIAMFATLADLFNARLD